MCSENNQNQEFLPEMNQETSLEQIVASDPNYRTEEEAFAIANGLPLEVIGPQGGRTEEQAVALAACEVPYYVDRQPGRDAVAGAFREELGHAMEAGAKVMSADKELRFCLELQRDRLARKNIRYKEELDPGKKPMRSPVNNVRSWQDGHYETSWSVGYIKRKRTAERDGMKTFKRTDPSSICETVIDVRDGENVSEDTYCCPNCGAVSTIKGLQEGCSQCGTSFQMTELYPKVGNYFFVDDPAVSTDPIWKTAIRYGLLALPVTIPLFSPMILFRSESGASMADMKFAVPPISMVIRYIFGMIITSPITGYFVWMLSLFFLSFAQLGKESPAALSVGRSRKRFAARMSRISPVYTFETFSSKITTLFRILVFSDNRESLPFNAVKDLGSALDNVVDCTFRGWMSCKKIKEEGNKVFVTGDVYVDTVRDMGSKLKVKSEVYQVTVGKRTDVPVLTNFSIAKIQCPSCGASFNSFKSKNCPYCGTECPPAEDDWVLYEVKNVYKQHLIKSILIAVVAFAILIGSILTTYGPFAKG